MKNITANSHKKWLFSKRRIYFSILKVLGLCSACFLFEACYGAPQNEEPPEFNMNIKGTVKSHDSLKPLQNINIAISNSGNSGNIYTSTSSTGFYTYNTIIKETKLNWTIKATDIDDSLNGKFMEKETTFVITDNEFNNNETNINLLLKKK